MSRTTHSVRYELEWYAMLIKERLIKVYRVIISKQHFMPMLFE